MLEFLINIASSAYFAMGASIVIVVCIILIIVPIMNRIKKLDEIVRLKLSLLPTSTIYSSILKELTLERTSIEVTVDEFQKIKEDIYKLKEQLLIFNDADFIKKMSEICDIETQQFLDELSDLEKSLSKFSIHIRDNEKRSEIQLNNLVAARIDTTDVLIDLVQELKDTNVIESIDIQKLHDVKRNLQRGYDSVQRQSHFKVLDSNDRSGNFDRFIDEDY